MADTVTTKHGFVKPEVNASDDTWGNKLNADWDQLDGLLDVRATTTEVLTGTATNRTVTPDALSALWERGTDISPAPSALLTLGEGGYFNIIGAATTLNDIDFATPKDGRMAWLRFSMAGTILVHSATLVLPGAANITTAVGDRALFVQDSGDTMYCLEYNGVGTASLPGMGVGFAVKTAAGAASWAARSLGAGTGISIINPDGVAGNPSISINTAAALTWTGQQTFGDGTGPAGIWIKGANGQGRTIDGFTVNSRRWQIIPGDASAESSGNAGSNFAIYRFDDAAAFIASAFSITRSTGIVNITSGLNVPIGGLLYGGATDILARANTWTANQTISKTNATFAVSSTSGSSEIQIDGPSGGNRVVDYMTGGVARWKTFADTIAEGGANSGSGFKLNAYSDAGGFLWTIMDVLRATGGVTFGVSISTPILQIAGTDIFARNNTWTGSNSWSQNMTLSKASPILVVDATSGVSLLQIRAVAGNLRGIQFLTGSGSERWRVQVDGTAEGGSNAGSNFAIAAYNDAGVFIDNAMSIARATGDVTFNYGTNFNFGSNVAASATTINVRSIIGQARNIAYYSGGNQRINLSVNNTAEGGANAGSDWVLNCYADGGGFLGSALTITRASMKATFAGDVVVNGSVLQANDADIVTNASGANHGFIRIQSATGTIHGISFRSGTNASPTGDRWRIYGGDAVAETGANVGANFAILSFTDTGTQLHSIMSVVRSTGVTTFLQGGGLVIGAATGGAKGVGTINAVGVYDDNVLLTCYVLEAANENKINLAKWDAINHGKPHAPARKFAQRIHVLNVDKYIAEWKETGVLPGMPDPEAWAAAGGMSTGDMIQRLWETVELLAVHIDQVNERAKAA